MMDLKQHPFAVEAVLKRTCVLTYALPKEQLHALVPKPLELDTFQDQWAFVAVAMVDTHALRPKGFPAFLGRSFFLVGYRIFVRYTTKEGRRLRGLYILQSETNKRSMQLLGNVFTHYHYRHIDVLCSEDEHSLEVQSHCAPFHVSVRHGDEAWRLPDGSPFSSWEEARRYAGPLPHTFSVNENKQQVCIVEGVRSQWKHRPLTVDHAQVGFIEKMGWKNAQLASAFELRDVPYFWKKGRVETWK